MSNKLNDEKAQISSDGGSVLIGKLTMVMLAFRGYIFMMQNQNKVEESEAAIVDEVEVSTLIIGRGR